MPDGIIILITLNDDDQIGDTPFNYYLFKSNKRWLEIWKDKNLVLECSIGKDMINLIKGITYYLDK